MGLENKLIWVFSLENTEKYIDIELYRGRNKYTKTGLFSGPLRRNDADTSASDNNFQFLCSLDSVAQVGKNKYKLHKTTAVKLLDYFHEQKIDEVYCLLKDKKLHHVSGFVSVGLTDSVSGIKYDGISGNLYYCSVTQNGISDTAVENVDNTYLQPKPRMYLFSEGKTIRGMLSFIYGDIEVPANSSDELINIGSETVFRNLHSETTVKNLIISVGGNKSLRNEFLFQTKIFFDSVLQRLLDENINLFWGKEKKTILKSKISCNISYGIDWFVVSGKVIGEKQEYTLSDLLRSSKGKNFVEIDNGIVFLPEELRKTSLEFTNSGLIQIPRSKLDDVVSIGECFNVNPTDYLNRFLNFTDSAYTLPNRIECILKPYQKEGIKWAVTLYRNGFGGCLADDMGLGKTLQAISFICCEERNNELPVLIIAPKIVLYNWKNEFGKFAPWSNVVVAYGNFDSLKMVENNTIYITTYDTLINHGNEFERIKFDTVVLDESQFVKNFRTQRYRAIQKIKSKYFLALTGTPIENSIEELWSLFNLINPGLLGSHGQFMSRFGEAHVEAARLNTLKKIVTPFIMRRTKEEVLKELPPKEEMYIYCEMSEGQKRLYDELLSSVRKELQAQPSRYQIKDNSIILQALLYLRETCSDPQLLPPTLRGIELSESCKYELFKDYAHRVMSESNKLIVYGMFPRVLKKMENWCKRLGWNTFYIDGSISNRQDIVDAFESSEQGVFFISLKAGGVGLNLVSCQYVFIYDPWWNTAAEQQAANRVYRIGQEKPVFIYHFLVKDTIEEKIYDLQKKKEKLSENILTKLDGSSKISLEDIYKLLI